jgi:tryptophan synthase alpha chain
MLENFREKNKTAFIPFVVAGFPSLEFTEKLVGVLVEEGADVIELGIPFTDAMADGPVIQIASGKAALNGITLPAVIELAQTLRKKHPTLGIVLFSYLNPIFKMGISQFANSAVLAGVNAALTVDLPPEESLQYREILKDKGLGTVFLSSPTTNPKRLPIIDEASSAFVYYISRSGVTGVQNQLSVSLEEELKVLRKKIKKPLVVGFGISSGPQVSWLAPKVDGVVVGSAFVKIIAENSNPSVALQKTRELARELKQAMQNSTK